ncbi:MAG: transglutaminase, partial [Bacteroidales bacterium]|nr:transglutaminase [Bacteroidales bacterium]
ADGTLVGEFTIEAEGQSDAGVRGVFSARYSEWQRNIEMELLKVDPRAEIVSVKYTNPEEYLKQPVKITYKYKIPNYARVSNDEMIFVPLSAKGLYTRAMNHLRISTDIEERNYAFKDRCSRLVEVKEEIVLPFAPAASEVILPQSETVKSEYVNYQGGYTHNGKTLTFEQTASYGKRVYEAHEWADFRKAVDAQKKFSTKHVVVKTK